ncbi:phospholipase A [Halomonas urumqiensis]|uniref:Phospholipase A1 n=1 Tax=Halomonas urumqiensis TaxID=1684789 RepID=A0A2N7UFH2_9GAMM|nr:phospholipase A [Halomonas urumqiensis]PMR79141.1 phospholipase [Halomonas urumqiensis]PTB03816.1 phospholipase [Halomonas urumqiensis]GHE19951.1 phospholipase [Halomonas urumqiensis]
MTSLIRSASLVATGMLLLGSVSTSMAADDTATVRANIESRMQDLNQELSVLREQLERLPDDNDEPLEPEDVAAIEAVERRQLELESRRNPFAITTFRRNYLLPVSYNTSPNREAFGDISSSNGPDDVELKFQFSAKVNLAEGLFGDYGDLYFAYTQRSWWQAYNTESSSPFRETNYEPELFMNFDNGWRGLGWTNVRNRVALNHQSNGRSDPLSRSWNRVYLESMFQRGDWGFSLAPHWRIPESQSEDDNPDIERYMGYGDVTLARRFGDQEVSLLWRGNPSAGNMGTQIDYSWPLFDSAVRAHVQYYYGYGESLIDYDHRSHRLSFGFSLNPLFSGGNIAR